MKEVFMTQITEYSPFAPEVKEDPYPYYAWLRERHPVYYNAKLGFYVLSRYADVEAAARTTEVFSSAQGIGLERAPVAMMISKDPPDHTRLRKLVSKAFTPKMVEQLAPRIQEIVDELLDAALSRGAFDLVQDFAYPLPVIMIAEMLGVEPARRDDFKRWSDAVIHVTAGGAQYGDRATYMQSWQEFKAYVSQIIEERRRSPRNDLISALVQAQDERDALTLNEILNFCLLLLVAGNETTTNLITNGALALYTHEAQRQKLRGQPQLIQSAIEEILRYDGPIQGVFRTTTRDVEVRGSTIAAQSKVLLLWASANRDPDVFPDPDRFDIERTPNDHMAFGRGIHFCLGAPLARLEARIATQTILRRTKVTRPDPEGVRERVDNALFRGLKRFPVVVEPANAA
jgi:cytochrome P450